MPFTLHIHGFLDRYESAGRPRLPELERILARAERTAGDHSLAPLFGLETLPAAPFTYLADTGKADGEYRLRADPVHLAADRDQLVLMPGSLLDTTQEEIRALTGAFNTLYGGDGWQLEWPRTERGYLLSPRTLMAVTYEPLVAAGRSVLEFMPRGEDAVTLKRLMNETQMLFHEHPVNRTREEEGRPLINSLWLWGGGRLPAPTGRAPTRVMTDMPLVRGLALWAGLELLPMTESAERAVVDDGLAAIDAEDLDVLETRWFAPLYRRIKERSLNGFDIQLGGLGGFHMDAARLRGFWRPRRPVTEFLP